MSAKQFCLKWNNFHSNILNAFESLQSSEDLTDVTLTCEGISVKAHKFILSACSPYFRTVFKVSFAPEKPNCEFILLPGKSMHPSNHNTERCFVYGSNSNSEFYVSWRSPRF